MQGSRGRGESGPDRGAGVGEFENLRSDLRQSIRAHGSPVYVGFLFLAGMGCFTMAGTPSLASPKPLPWSSAECTVLAAGIQYMGDCDLTSKESTSFDFRHGNYSECGPFTWCSEEGGKCSCDGTVRFGEGNLHVEQDVHGSIDCRIDAFGGKDPAPFRRKQCLCRPEALRSVSESFDQTFAKCEAEATREVNTGFERRLSASTDVMTLTAKDGAAKTEPGQCCYYKGCAGNDCDSHLDWCSTSESHCKTCDGSFCPLSGKEREDLKKENVLQKQELNGSFTESTPAAVAKESEKASMVFKEGKLIKPPTLVETKAGGLAIMDATAQAPDCTNSFLTWGLVEVRNGDDVVGHRCAYRYGSAELSQSAQVGVEDDLFTELSEKIGKTATCNVLQGTKPADCVVALREPSAGLLVRWRMAFDDDVSSRFQLCWGVLAICFFGLGGLKLYRLSSHEEEYDDSGYSRI